MTGDVEPEAIETAARPIVYLRRVGQGAQTANGEAIPPDAYAIHDENGRPIAVFPDRDTAIVAARVNDMRPLSLH